MTFYEINRYIFTYNEREGTNKRLNRYKEMLENRMLISLRRVDVGKIFLLQSHHSYH